MKSGAPPGGVRPHAEAVSPLEVRRLAESEAAIFRAARLEGLERHPEAFGSAFEEEVDLPLETYAERLRLHATWGAFGEVELVGVASLVLHAGLKTRHKATLVGVYVRPKARGRGAARAMILEALEFARGKVELVQLGVGSENASARRLYESLGFEAYGAEPRAFRLGDRYVDDVLMWREVSA